MSTTNKRVELRVHAEIVANAERTTPPKLAAYAYSAGGALLDQGSVDAEGHATLQLPPASAPTSVRVLVGPVIDSADLAELTRRGARELHLRLSPKDQSLSAKLTLLPPDWLCWLRSACFVKGTLLKRVTSGGVSLDLPVCHATVDVYEVDPLHLIVPRIPLEILERIRELIVGPQPPFPIPGPDPAPFERVPRAQRPVASAAHGLDASALTALREASESQPLRLAAQTRSLEQFRNVLPAHAVVVRPLLCAFFPQWVTMQKVATAVTDDCGHFRTLFFNGCHNPDQPDLYFKARQRLFGLFEVTVYAPTPIACHTYWDYACGTEVTLITTNPLAITCSPCPPVSAPDNWVLFTAIGNHSLHAIFGAGAAGADATNRGLTADGRPWGGVLRPRLDFDNSLRESLGVKYYQLSWRAGTSGGFTPLTTEVFRHYAHVVGGDLVIEPYRLGPDYKSVGGESLALFEIPPAVPPIGQWTVLNAVLDTENGEFPSEAHAPGLQFQEDGSVVAGTSDGSGLYQLKLDLYDDAGNLIDIAAKGIKYVVPDSDSLAGTIHGVPAANIAQPGGGFLSMGNSLILTLHVDNNRCWADLGPASTPSGASDPCCGVVDYAPGVSVSLPYTAFHPHGFATHDLRVYRSATQILPTITGGVGSFTVTRSVADMMTLALPASCAGNPPCTTAAFAENLRVHALATDGWGTLLGYGDDDNRAFALAPA